MQFEVANLIGLFPSHRLDGLQICDELKFDQIHFESNIYHSEIDG